MKLNTKIQNAVVLLLDINTHGDEKKAVGLKEISDRQKLSLTYLEQISRKLRKAKIIESVRGPGGGYVLKANLAELSLFDVHMAVGENCSFKYAFETDSPEIVDALDVFAKLEEAMQNILKESFVIEQSNILSIAQ